MMALFLQAVVFATTVSLPVEGSRQGSRRPPAIETGDSPEDVDIPMSRTPTPLGSRSVKEKIDWRQYLVTRLPSSSTSPANGVLSAGSSGSSGSVVSPAILVHRDSSRTTPRAEKEKPQPINGHEHWAYQLLISDAVRYAEGQGDEEKGKMVRELAYSGLRYFAGRSFEEYSREHMDPSLRVKMAQEAGGLPPLLKLSKVLKNYDALAAGLRHIATAAAGTGIAGKLAPAKDGVERQLLTLRKQFAQVFQGVVVHEDAARPPVDEDYYPQTADPDPRTDLDAWRLWRDSWRTFSTREPTTRPWLDNGSVFDDGDGPATLPDGTTPISPRRSVYMALRDLDRVHTMAQATLAEKLHYNADTLALTWLLEDVLKGIGEREERERALLGVESPKGTGTREGHYVQTELRSQAEQLEEEGFLPNFLAWLRQVLIPKLGNLADATLTAQQAERVRAFNKSLLNTSEDKGLVGGLLGLVGGSQATGLATVIRELYSPPEILSTQVPHNESLDDARATLQKFLRTSSQMHYTPALQVWNRNWRRFARSKHCRRVSMTSEVNPKLGFSDDFEHDRRATTRNHDQRRYLQNLILQIQEADHTPTPQETDNVMQMFLEMWWGSKFGSDKQDVGQWALSKEVKLGYCHFAGWRAEHDERSTARQDAAVKALSGVVELPTELTTALANAQWERQASVSEHDLLVLRPVKEKILELYASTTGFLQDWLSDRAHIAMARRFKQHTRDESPKPSPIKPAAYGGREPSLDSCASSASSRRPSSRFRKWGSAKCKENRTANTSRGAHSHSRELVAPVSSVAPQTSSRRYSGSVWGSMVLGYMYVASRPGDITSLGGSELQKLLVKGFYTSEHRAVPQKHRNSGPTVLLTVRRQTACGADVRWAVDVRNHLTNYPQTFSGLDITSGLNEIVQNHQDDDPRNTCDIAGMRAVFSLIQQIVQNTRLDPTDETTPLYYTPANPFVFRVHMWEGVTGGSLNLQRKLADEQFYANLSSVLAEQAADGFPFQQVQFQVGHTANVAQEHFAQPVQEDVATQEELEQEEITRELRLARAQSQYLGWALISQPWASVVFNANLYSNLLLQSGYDVFTHLLALADVLRRCQQDGHTTCRFSLGADGIGVLGTLQPGTRDDGPRSAWDATRRLQHALGTKFFPVAMMQLPEENSVGSAANTPNGHGGFTAGTPRSARKGTPSGANSGKGPMTPKSGATPPSSGPASGSSRGDVAGLPPAFRAMSLEEYNRNKRTQRGHAIERWERARSVGFSPMGDSGAAVPSQSPQLLTPIQSEPGSPPSNRKSRGSASRRGERSSSLRRVVARDDHRPRPDPRRPEVGDSVVRGNLF
ncbi:unnamed protein product [Amoebophrya sp. A120]|nr:unnamed protein product [Amoebophrya sp. A120]|eukprot:GSA120T00017388001.1